VTELKSRFTVANYLTPHSDIVALLVFIRLEEYNYGAAAAIATVMLAMAFVMLIVTNAIQAWHLRYIGARD